MITITVTSLDGERNAIQLDEPVTVSEALASLGLSSSLRVRKKESNGELTSLVGDFVLNADTELRVFPQMKAGQPDDEETVQVVEEAAEPEAQAEDLPTVEDILDEIQTPAAE